MDDYSVFCTRDQQLLVDCVEFGNWLFVSLAVYFREIRHFRFEKSDVSTGSGVIPEILRSGLKISYLDRK